MLDENVSWRYHTKTVGNKLLKNIALLCRAKQFLYETSFKSIIFFISFSCSDKDRYEASCVEFLYEHYYFLESLRKEEDILLL